MADDPLHLFFDQHTYPDAAARCAAWRDAFSLSVDTVFATGEVEGFQASARFRTLGPVLLTDTVYTGHTVVRDRRTIARTGSEQVILDLFVAGGFTGRVGGRSCPVVPGDGFVMDMRGTFRVRLKPGRFLGLIMPRSLFEKAVGSDASLHGLVLPASGAPAQMLGALFAAAAERMHELTPAFAEALGPALVGTVAACLRDVAGASLPASARRGTQSPLRRSTEPTVARLSRHIRRHAADPAYDADALAEAYKLSRSALYRLFQPAGGVAAAIRRRRAALALRLLREGKGHALAPVAQASGLSNERALRRALWSEYGATPGALRRTSKGEGSDGPELAIGALFDELPR